MKTLLAVGAIAVLIAGTFYSPTMLVAAIAVLVTAQAAKIAWKAAGAVIAFAAVLTVAFAGGSAGFFFAVMMVVATLYLRPYLVKGIKAIFA